MPSHWHPDEEFLEFLEFLQSYSGVEITVQGKSCISEIRAGTDIGRELYDSMYTDPDFQEGFENWKKLQKP